MKNLFVSYEIAKQLKEKGFNESCFATYFATDKIIHAGKHDNLHPTDKSLLYATKYPYCNSDNTITAPTHQQTTDWLREQYGIHIDCQVEGENFNVYRFMVFRSHNERVKETINFLSDENYNRNYPTYYDALNNAIEHALKLIPICK